MTEETPEVDFEVRPEDQPDPALFDAIAIDRPEVWETLAIWARTPSANVAAALQSAVKSIDWSVQLTALQPTFQDLLANQLPKLGSYMETHSLIQAAIAAQANMASTIQLLDYDNWVRAADASDDAREAIDTAAAELRHQRPGLSRSLARKMVIAYAYVLSLAALMTACFVYPDIAKVVLSAGGISALKLKDAAGKAFDLLNPEPDDTEE